MSDLVVPALASIALSAPGILAVVLARRRERSPGRSWHPAIAWTVATITIIGACAGLLGYSQALASAEGVDDGSIGMSRALLLGAFVGNGVAGLVLLAWFRLRPQRAGPTPR